MVQSMPAYHRNDGNAVSKDVTVPGNVEKNRIFWLPLYVDQRLLYLYKEIVWKNHRRTGNFLPGGGGAVGAVNHLPKKFSQVAQIFTKQ